jgi:hypothetical protein
VCLPNCHKPLRVHHLEAHVHGCACGTLHRTLIHWRQVILSHPFTFRIQDAREDWLISVKRVVEVVTLTCSVGKPFSSRLCAAATGLCAVPTLQHPSLKTLQHGHSLLTVDWVSTFCMRAHDSHRRFSCLTNMGMSLEAPRSCRCLNYLDSQPINNLHVHLAWESSLHMVQLRLFPGCGSDVDPRCRCPHYRPGSASSGLTDVYSFSSSVNEGQRGLWKGRCNLGMGLTQSTA